MPPETGGADITRLIAAVAVTEYSGRLCQGIFTIYVAVVFCGIIYFIVGDIYAEKKKVFVITAAAVSFIAVVYLGVTLFFTDHFYMNTVINGVDYSACSVEVVQNRIMDTSGHYSLTVNGRDGMTDTITSADIALRSVFGDEFEELIAGQNAFLWPLSFFRQSEHTVDTMVTYSKEELERKIDTLCFFQPENIRQPRNAYLSDYTEEGYQVVPEDKGTVPIRRKIYRAVEEAVDALAASVNLDEKECYTDARITSSDRSCSGYVNRKTALQV